MNKFNEADYINKLVDYKYFKKKLNSKKTYVYDSANSFITTCLTDGVKSIYNNNFDKRIDELSSCLDNPKLKAKFDFEKAIINSSDQYRNKLLLNVLTRSMIDFNDENKINEVGKLINNTINKLSSYEVNYDIDSMITYCESLNNLIHSQDKKEKEKTKIKK